MEDKSDETKENPCMVIKTQGFIVSLKRLISLV